MRRILIALLACACLCAPALAETGVCFSGDTSVRTGPGPDYATIGSAGADVTLDWTGDAAEDDLGVTWYGVRFAGGTGWVSSRYATLSDEDDGWEFYDGGEPYDDGLDDYDSATTVYGASGDSNVRTGPGLDYDVLGTLTQGDTAVYLGGTSYDNRGVAWYQIAWKNGVGWVSSRYTALY